MYKYIFDAGKHKITSLVTDAKLVFVSARILASKAALEFQLVSWQRAFSPEPTKHQPVALPTVLTDGFTDKIETIRRSF